ncbi:MAG: uracil-DNA glycosylase, partial [Pseudomonadales bacterium]|nr:uracil-DNA glycosylase [Pseudomonadales bacterium]
FSVPNGVAPPPSLLNIFQEINSDLGTEEGREIRRGRGCLEGWTRQGVLLLNSVLTVLEKRAGSHQAQVWERFTDAVVGAVNSQLDGVVFLLWGGKAREKGMLVDRSRHHVLEAAHPSPLSATSGFFGCRHFSKTTQILDTAGKAPIDWFDVQ